MLDHDLDFPIDFIEACDRAGVCPFCGSDAPTCTCDDDAEFVIEVAAHPMGCVCCADDLAALDVPYDIAPARVVWSAPRRAPRWDESKSLISSGADF